MTERSEQLEQELNTIWQQAPNTRKQTAPRRIEHILQMSRAELSLRDLLTFFIYLGQACFMFSVAVGQSLFTTSGSSDQQQGTKQ